MLQKTNQSGLHQSIFPLIRRYRVDHLYLNINELAIKWALDCLKSRVNAICGNVRIFVFTNVNFVEAYTKPIKDHQDDTDSFQ